MSALKYKDDIRKRPRAPPRVEVVDMFGDIHGPFGTLIQANTYVRKKWPDQQQDSSRTGKGWDVQIVGCE